MALMQLRSFAAGEWVGPNDSARVIANAATGENIAVAGNSSLDMSAMVSFAKNTGGPALRELTFHDRARMLKALASHIGAHKEELYDLSYMTGATRKDSWVDIDGGIGTMFVYASKGRREMPDAKVFADGDIEHLSKSGTFIGQHICTPLHGVAVHINAFNFPVWGMLEKLAPTLLAGVPAIVKPATATAYLTERCFELMIESGILPDGAIQLITGGTGDLLERLDYQDVVSFTGSAQTAQMLRSNSGVMKRGTRFIAEQDSLNASVLGPDAGPDTPEFDIFIREVVREMTTKAGQKCTAIRRIMVPHEIIDTVIEALEGKLSKVVIGDPSHADTTMGSLVSLSQRRDVLEKAQMIGEECTRVIGDPDNFKVESANRSAGAFVPPMLFRCDDPDRANHVHDVEAFGPVSTVLGYRDMDHAGELLNRGKGSLVASLFSHDPNVAVELVGKAAASHGRIYINNRNSAGESTGHGSPLPHMVHGGPGRAGGGEELGGIRGAMHYMQRTAIQGSPAMISAITGTWVKGAPTVSTDIHPFRKAFDDLQIGETIITEPRTISMDDIEHFAEFTGDTFYAHMDEEAAAANPFFPGRVAHGYLLLSFAAGLFVDPAPGPVLANTGLNSLSFQKPVVPGDSIRAQLTVKRKTKRNDDYGEVAWNVALTNQDGDQVAEYELLTMVAY